MVVLDMKNTTLNELQSNRKLKSVQLKTTLEKISLWNTILGAGDAGAKLAALLVRA